MVRTRNYVHVFFSILILIVILLFNAVNDASVVSAIFKVATFTYGPLIGLYGFSLYAKKRNVLDRATPFICILAPLGCFFFGQVFCQALWGLRICRRTYHCQRVAYIHRFTDCF